MHLIDQELAGLNQLDAIVGAISGYLCGKQFGQLCLTVAWKIIWGKKGLWMGDMGTVHENKQNPNNNNNNNKQKHTMHLVLYPLLYAPWKFYFCTVVVMT